MSYLRGEYVQRRGIHRFGVWSRVVRFRIDGRVCEGEFCDWGSDRWDDVSGQVEGVLAGVRRGRKWGIAAKLDF